MDEQQTTNEAADGRSDLTAVLCAEIAMNNDVLKRDAIYKAAGLARGDGLSGLYGLCETQKTISTKKVMEHIERTHEFMKDCAHHMRKLADQLPAQDLTERHERQPDQPEGGAW